MKLCRSLYGHGWTCDCTQVTSKPAAGCLGSCEPAGPCPPWTCFVLIERVFRWSEVGCALKAPLAGQVQGSAELFKPSQSAPAPLSTDRSWMCTFSCLCHRRCVRTCQWRFLVGVCVCIPGWGSHLLDWAFGKGEKTVAEADWPWFVGLCFLFHFKTGVWRFGSGEKWFACLGFIWKVTYMPIFKWEEWERNYFNKWNMPLKLCIPMNRDCRYIQPKKPKPCQLFYSIKLISWNIHLSMLQKFLESLSISALGILIRTTNLYGEFLTFPCTAPLTAQVLRRHPSFTIFIAKFKAHFNTSDVMHVWNLHFR